jgi:predicted RNA-binding Zn-ribbon protein involved in translation (DUF1610 family)
MVCAYCESRTEVERGEAVILERPLSGADEASTGLGLEMRAIRCENCGATVTFGETATADHCVYCGSPNVLDQEMNRNAIRPESLIPLDVGREAVNRNLKSWRDGLWFRPNALKRAGKFAAVGVYVPFWTFDCLLALVGGVRNLLLGHRVLHDDRERPDGAEDATGPEDPVAPRVRQP